MKAFQVYDPATGLKAIVYHESAGEARYSAFLAASAVGWEPVLIELACRRRPDLDDAKVLDGYQPKRGLCYAEDALAVRECGQDESGGGE